MTDEALLGRKKGVDPLKMGPEAGLEVYKRYQRASIGFPYDLVTNAAANIILNVLRQSHKKKSKADDALRQLLERMRGVLDDHYDHAGNRRSIFPFNQNIDVGNVIKFPK